MRHFAPQYTTFGMPSEAPNLEVSPGVADDMTSAGIASHLNRLIGPLCLKPNRRNYGSFHACTCSRRNQQFGTSAQGSKASPSAAGKQSSGPDVDIAGAPRRRF